jgi:hypothetical protein
LIATSMLAINLLDALIVVNLDIFLNIVNVHGCFLPQV